MKSDFNSAEVRDTIRESQIKALEKRTGSPGLSEAISRMSRRSYYKTERKRRKCNVPNVRRHAKTRISFACPVVLLEGAGVSVRIAALQYCREVVSVQPVAET